MPFEVTPFQLPCGVPALRVEITGTISTEVAREYIQRVDPGGDLFGLPALVLTQRMESISTEGRAAFAGRVELGDREPWMAAVVTNPVIRVTANFINRVQGARRNKVFVTEPEALRWLDGRVRESLEAKNQEA